MSGARMTGLAVVLLAPAAALAAPGIPAVTVTPGPGGETWSVSLQLVMLMTALTFLPSIVLMMTSFARIIIVLSLLRQALGTQSTPPNQVLLGLALFLTFFLMSPVLERSWNDGLSPYMDGKLEARVAFERGVQPFREFMLKHTREPDLALFAKLSGREGFESPDDVPLSALVPAFATSELKTAFQIGFLIFIPFLIVDLVVASVLMSMGMMMLSPMLVALPFKLMLFVLVDGWTLTLGTLAASFQT